MKKKAKTPKRPDFFCTPSAFAGWSAFKALPHLGRLKQPVPAKGFALRGKKASAGFTPP